MAVINGKWKLTSMSNMEAFHDAISTPPEFKVKAMDPSTTHMLDIDASGGSFERSMFVNGEKVWAKEYKLGVEQETSGPDGRHATVNAHLVNDNKITFETKVSDIEMTGSMEAEGNELTLTMIFNEVTANQKFTRI